MILKYLSPPVVESTWDKRTSPQNMKITLLILETTSGMFKAKVRTPYVCPLSLGIIKIQNLYFTFSPVSKYWLCSFQTETQLFFVATSISVMFRF